ncbi:steryl-sulfatase-like [Pollicipes pollicipes]|uniref:steryl-sulfatase-like n=1 Tax=Pollicipes pollicipes TaxID=41117 RepID=UPI00188557EB|nr:steryl-sulfatase-like [Pollicipes pollicipes]
MRWPLLLLATLSYTASAVAAAENRPNFLVLLVDDLGYGDIGPFGNTSIPTPNIDRLAAEGAVLKQSLVAAAMCTPSRAALLTGRLPIRYGLAPQEDEWEIILLAASRLGLLPNETTLPKVLGRHGYTSSLVGKWHLGISCQRYGDHCHHPLTHGFDSFYGIPMTNLKDFGDDGETVYASVHPNGFPILYALMAGGVMSALFFRRRSRLLLALSLALTGAALLTALFFANWKILSSLIMQDEQVVEQPMRLKGLAQRFVAETEERLAAHARAGRPFFHMHSFCKMHAALAVADEFRGKSRHGLYGDSVLELDWAVGRILHTLRRLGLDRNTFVYFTSDNGGHTEERGINGDVQGGFNGPLKGGKGMGGMEGGIRMPTMVRYPPRVPAGSVVDLPVSSMDLLPTALRLAGLDVSRELPNREIDGRDMLPLLSGAAHVSPHRFLFHYCKATIHSARWMEDAAHTWKVHFYWPPWIPGTQRCPYICQCHHSLVLPQPAVYNIQQDISEERPLSPDTAQYGRVLQTMRNAVEQHQAGLEGVPSQMTWWDHMWRPQLQACCQPPFCRCTDPKYP